MHNQNEIQAHVESEIRKRVKPRKLKTRAALKEKKEKEKKGIVECEEDGVLYVSDGQRFKKVRIFPDAPGRVTP